ncbi:hypothetical protein DFH06DRAFT_1415994 [Mycena polygramma]|nr:hypothetical protein DFH06DRAFT_1415994 [Mycena polygramma]
MNFLPVIPAPERAVKQILSCASRSSTSGFNVEVLTFRANQRPKSRIRNPTPGEHNSQNKISLACSFSQSHQGPSCELPKTKQTRLFRTTTIPPSLSLPKNAKTRRIAFPQAIPTFLRKGRRQACVAYTCNAPVPTHVVHLLSTTEAPRSGAENLDTIYANQLNPRKKSRRQAHTTSTRISPGPADVVLLLSTTEAPRSGADNAEAMYRRPASRVKSSAHGAHTFNAPCPRPNHFQHCDPRIVEAPRSGMKSFVSKRLPAGTLPFQLHSAVACAMHANTINAVEFCLHTDSPAFDSSTSGEAQIQIWGFGVPRTEASSVALGLSPTLQSFDSRFALPTSKMTGLLYVSFNAAVPHLSTTALAWIVWTSRDRGSLTMGCVQPSLSLTPRANRISSCYAPSRGAPIPHSIVYRSGTKSNSGASLHFPLKTLRSNSKSPLTFELNHASAISAKLDLAPQLPLPVGPSLFLPSPPPQIPVPLISTAADLRERRDYDLTRKYVSQQSGD